jgi:hypothetical protein
VCNALFFIYQNRPSGPSLKWLNANPTWYHSDELTIYGEFYSLFGGWLSLVAFFIVGFIFQDLYKRKNKNDGQNTLRKGLVLYFFYKLINSYGLDWLVGDIIAAFFCYYIMCITIRGLKSKYFATNSFGSRN